MQVAALQSVYHQMTLAGNRTEGSNRGTPTEREDRMAVLSRVMENAAAVVAVIVGVPLVVMLFLGVLGYCYLEWLCDTLVSRLSMPTRPMRTIEASP